MDLFGGLSVKQESSSRAPSPAPDAPAAPAAPATPVEAPDTGRESTGSAFSFLNSPPPEPEPEAPKSPEPSLLDLQAEPEEIRLPTPELPKPVARRPIVKKKRAKRVGYERTDEDAATPPATPPPEPEAEPEEPPQEEEPSPPEDAAADPDQGLSAEQAAWLREAAEAPAPAPRAAPPAQPPLRAPEKKSSKVIASISDAGKRFTGVFKRPSPRQKSPPAPAPAPPVAESSSDDEDDGDTSDLEAKVRAAMARNDSDESLDELAYSPKEAAPPVKQPGQDLAATLDAFVVATEDLCMRLAAHERRGVDAQRERQALAEERATLDDALAKVLREQAELAEAEDYEGADALQVRVDAARREVELRVERLDELDRDVHSEDSHIEGRQRDYETALRELAGWLRRFEGDQRSVLTCEVANTDRKAASDAKRLSAEAERLAMERAHVDRDAALVADEFERMEALIEQQTSGDLERRDALADQQALKELELDDLKRRVAILEAERDAVEAELEDCEGKVALARSKFERQLQRLAQRDSMVKASAQDCAREAGVLDAEQAQQACVGARVAADLAARTRVADAALAELTAADHLQGARPVWVCDEVAGDDASLATPRAAYAAAETELREANGARTALDDDAATLRAALAALDDRLPELDRQKKAAASARNYKEAGALAKEAKDLSAARGAKEETLAALAAPRAAASEAVDAARARRDDARAALDAVAREADVVVLRSLRRRARALGRCRRALARRGAGLRLDAAADALVRCELATLDARCSDLKRKSGLEDVAESDSDSDASQDEAAPVVEAEPESPASAAEPEAAAASEEPAEDEAIAAADEAPAEEDPPEAAEARAALAARLADLEKDIEQAVEAEDYERADELNTAADGLRAEMDE